MNKDIPEIKKIQNIKKKYFEKIINWFNLFDNYAKQINENSALGNFKDVLNAYIHNFNSNNNKSDIKNQSAILFQVNLQRCDFLKGKFALTCQNYSDALLFLIKAAKQKRIVIDGLIKKRALKHIVKIADKAKKAIITNNYSSINYLEIAEKLGNIKKENKIYKKLITLQSIHSTKEKDIEKEQPKKVMKLIDKIKELIVQVKEDIDETNEKQLKDIIILIDFNLTTNLMIDSYIDVVKTILKNYLTNNDRICIFLLENEYRIICPMTCKKDIDIINFYKDLDLASENFFKKEKIEIASFTDIIQEKSVDEEIHSVKTSESAFSGNEDEEEIINDKGITIEDTIKSLNYCLSYLKMKEISGNEQYFMYFNSNMKILMNYLKQNNSKKKNEQKKKVKLQKEPKINFLLIGKVEKENEDFYNEILGNYFGSKSEVVPYDNMKKIQSILSSNNIINDNITFSNEIYN